MCLSGSTQLRCQGKVSYLSPSLTPSSICNNNCFPPQILLITLVGFLCRSTRMHAYTHPPSSHGMISEGLLYSFHSSIIHMFVSDMDMGFQSMTKSRVNKEIKISWDQVLPEMHALTLQLHRNISEAVKFRVKSQHVAGHLQDRQLAPLWPSSTMSTLGRKHWGLTDLSLLCGLKCQRWAEWGCKSLKTGQCFAKKKKPNTK